MKNIQKIALLIACCLTTITPNLGFADESNTKLLFEQTCYQLVKEDWLSEDFTIMECSENKQFDAGFLKVLKYLEWVATIILVPKKYGKVRMCVDYQDLN